MEDFAGRLRALLEEKGISQLKLAESVGCSRQSITFYISGKRLPDIAVAAKIACALEVSCDYLIGASQYRGAGESTISAEKAGVGEEAFRLFRSLSGSEDQVRLCMLNRFLGNARMEDLLSGLDEYRLLRQSRGASLDPERKRQQDFCLFHLTKTFLEITEETIE